MAHTALTIPSGNQYRKGWARWSGRWLFGTRSRVVDDTSGS